MQGWIKDQAQVPAPSTLQLLVALLRSIFAAAVQDRLIGSSPVEPAEVGERAGRPSEHRAGAGTGGRVA